MVDEAGAWLPRVSVDGARPLTLRVRCAHVPLRTCRLADVAPGRRRASDARTPVPAVRGRQLTVVPHGLHVLSTGCGGGQRPDPLLPSGGLCAKEGENGRVDGLRATMR